ncbi:MAG: DUF808 domain-containing protein [Pseudopedobacter saltans]|uniref:DUF808 domain-containing protein n=1 Tax=Pseudopedobacter saltans TaxID=151895 RepID=A0A2W5F7R5_9SPHI|nr:MAG: DUF808 domain-containing protein [Pseudopedobacter saltans]
MASGFFALLDDIGALMDDIAVTTKVAANKTAGILGDDLAVNAEKATGFVSSRELPVLWAITKGSLLNKAIIVPIALALNAYFPAALNYILILGGFYLAYEGAEKIVEFLFHRKNHHAEEIKEVKSNNVVDDEKAKIKAAIATDFILSIEIVIIALSQATEHKHAFITTIVVVALVSVLATVGVYGIVALIVRMDDAGVFLINKTHNKGFFSKIGHLLVKGLPIIIKILAVLGTLALFLVSGEIFMHKIEYLHHILSVIPELLRKFLFGLVAGLLVVLLMTGGKNVVKLIKKKA